MRHGGLKICDVAGCRAAAPDTGLADVRTYWSGYAKFELCAEHAHFFDTHSQKLKAWADDYKRALDAFAADWASRNPEPRVLETWNTLELAGLSENQEA